MKSFSGISWKTSSIPERLIQKKQQDYKISYLLSKIFLHNNFSDDEIHHSLYKKKIINIEYKNDDLIKASNLFNECIKQKQNILIFGDYDVDGYSSTYLLYDYIKSLNISCDFYIPDRFNDGYGPNKELLINLIRKKKYNLVIFVDCATNSSHELNILNEKGIKTIVIDHHQIYKKNNAKNTIIINPFKNFINDQYTSLCAAALVYFFIKYVHNNFVTSVKFNDNKYLFFAALATICDQMPLRNLNRKIVKEGLNNFNFNEFNNFKNILRLKNKISSTDIGFNLGPILNSAGRLGYSDLPMKLLIEKNSSKINLISDKLINLNKKRKEIQTKTFNLFNIKKHTKNDEVIFHYKNNINEGILGIIAANFVEIYGRPSFIMTSSNNKIKCSSRSIYGFDIGSLFNEALSEKIILKGGGHSMAGGCVLNLNKLSEFKKFINIKFRKFFKNHKAIKYYISEQNLDSLKSFAKNDLQKLEPFGSNNINPIFLIKKNRIIKFKIVNNLHLQVLIKNNYKKSCLCFMFNAIGTKLGDLLINYKKNIDLLVQVNNKIIHKNSDFNLIIKDAIT
tara:strand:+ start:2258 stop:3952 length:1695 start_codon:yes stop_codon:yes gene_type:complete